MAKNEKIFLDNCWYAAAWDYEVVDANNKLARTICEKPIVFFKTDSGKHVALDNRCCHRAAPLSMGRVEGNCIRCMYHGMLYNEEGKCIEVPGQDTLPDTLRVKSYPLYEKGHMLWIWMGDPALANPNDILDYPPLSDPDHWRGLPKPAYLHYDANWLLIVDNLCDFSHIAFVHTNTLGGSEAYAYSSSPEEIERMDDGFRIERWHNDSSAPPFHSKVLPKEERDNKVDRCNLVEMRIPGVFFMETFFVPTGWNKEKGDRSGCREYRNCQYMTPETRSTTHFFWNYLHNYELDNPEISTSLRDSLLDGFFEDKVIIEAQQKLLETDTEFDPRFLVADKAFAHIRRAWKKRLDEELLQYPPEPLKKNKNRIL